MLLYFLVNQILNSLYQNLFVIILCCAPLLEASMYVGARGGMIDFKNDKVTAVGVGTPAGTGTTNWPSTKQTFEIQRKDDDEIQYNMAAIIGYNSNAINFEIEGGISNLDCAIEKDGLKDYTLYKITPLYGLINGYVSLQTVTPIAPYIGGGIGMMKAYFDSSINEIPAKNLDDELVDGNSTATVKNFVNIFSDKISANQIIFQISSGVNIALTRSLSLSIDYRKFDKLSELKFEQEKNKSVRISTPYKHTTVGASMKIKI